MILIFNKCSLFVTKLSDSSGCNLVIFRGEQKTIRNKFVLPSAVTCLIWLPDDKIVFGTDEGKVGKMMSLSLILVSLALVKLFTRHD